ncbi:hypothetical protein V7S43_001182 [Phytophthora oleae]|uniref:TKL protein kinase n=1 Tax=Phytophthora oleae TaxID=2107226 RepID=A0ABD3G2U1_9STRA
MSGVSASACTQTASDGDAAVGISITTDGTCASGGVGCIDNICRYCRTKSTAQSAHFNACPEASKACATTVSEGDAAVGINIVTDASCAQGGLGCIDSICRFCRTITTAQSATYPDCASVGSSSSTTPAPTPTPTTSPTTSSVSTYAIPLECYKTVSGGDKNVGLDIVSDLRCGDGGVGCVDSICRYCKRFDTAQSSGYLSCSDIPSSDIGADITFKAIVTDDTVAQESATNNTIVPLHESDAFTLVWTDGICADVSLADGQAAGGVGVVLDTVNCPEGTASGCVGNKGCRYCMRFPTNTSEYLEYCAVINSTSVAYALSGISPSTDDGSILSADVSSMSTLSAEADTAISTETSATYSKSPILGESGSTLWIAVGTVCAVLAVVGFAAFGLKRTVGSRKRSNAQSSEKEEVNPDTENRPSVLTTSNVGEPSIISDV